MMVTLFERMVGLDGERISVHSVTSSFRELHRGKLTVQGIITALNLTQDQQTDMQTIWVAISTSADPVARLREFFDLLILAEITRRVGSDYTDKDIFWARIASFS